MNITLIGKQLKGRLTINLEDGYEVCVTQACVPKCFYFNTSNLKIEVRLNEDKKEVFLRPGYYPTVADMIAKLNSLVANEQKSVTFMYNSNTCLAAVMCQDRATVLLPREICSVLKLPHASLRQMTVGSGPVEYNTGHQYVLMTSDVVEPQTYNNVALPLLAVLPLDSDLNSWSISSGYVKMRKITGFREFHVNLLDPVTRKPFPFINGEAMVRLHIKKSA